MSNDDDIDWSKPNVMESAEDIDWSIPNHTQSNTGWGAVGRDIQSLPGKAWEGGKGIFKTIGEEAPYFGESHAQNPTRAPRTAYASGVKGINSLLNLPGHARDYLANKEVIPRGTPSFRFPEEIVPREVNEGELYKALGLGEKRRGDIFGELVPDLLGGAAGATEAGAKLASGATKLAKATPELARKGGELSLIGAKKAGELSLVGAKKAGELSLVGAGKAIGLVGKGAKKTGELTGKGFKKYAPKIAELHEKSQARAKKIEGIEAEQRATKRQLHEINKKLPENQIERADDIQKILDAEQAKRLPTAESISAYGATQEQKKIGALTKSLTEAKEKITKPISEEWKEFGNSEAMHKGILEPIQQDSFTKEFGNPAEFASERLQGLIKKAVGHTENVKAHTDIIQGAVPAKKVHHQKRPLIKDYLALYRQARDEAADFHADSKNMNLTTEQRKAAEGKASKLKRLSKDASRKLEGYLDPNELRQYKDLKYRHEHYELPWRESNLLKNATERHATIGNENFSKGLTKENYPHLMNKLIEEHPGFRDSMAHYDLQGFDYSNPENIHKLLNSDQGRALPEKLQKDLGDMAKSLEHQKELEKLRSSLTKGEIINQIHSKELKDILKNHPDLAEPFTSDMDLRKKKRELQNYLKDLGLNKEEIEANMSAFEKAIGWAKTGAGLVGGPLSKVAKLAGLLGG